MVVFIKAFWVFSLLGSLLQQLSFNRSPGAWKSFRLVVDVQAWTPSSSSSLLSSTREMRRSGPRRERNRGRWTRPAVAAAAAVAPTTDSSELDHLAVLQKAKKERLRQLIRQAPSNAPSPPGLTRQILALVQELQQAFFTTTTTTRASSSLASSSSTTSSGSSHDPTAWLLPALAGTWELQWTAQDPQQPEMRQQPFWRTVILNPLENQAFYSNNPNRAAAAATQRGGQANPFLPLPVQQFLQDQLPTDMEYTAALPSTKSTQVIDVSNQSIRNVVTFTWPEIRRRRAAADDPRAVTPTPSRPVGRATLTVSIAFRPHVQDPFRLNVRFKACRLTIPSLSVDCQLPLGPLGPSGWLRTVYLDPDLRITRGHKGSVFILTRPGTFPSS